VGLPEAIDGVGDQLVAGGVEVEQGVADGGFEVVGVEAVDGDDAVDDGFAFGLWADSQCPVSAHSSRWRFTLARVCYWAPQQTLAIRAADHKAGQRAKDLKRVATTLVLLADSELARHFDLSRRACDPPLYEDRVMRQPRIAYFGCALALQPKRSPLLPTPAYHFRGIFIRNSFSAFRNAIFSLSSRGKSTPRNQSVCAFMSANG
jgi:hypothetical protein